MPTETLLAPGDRCSSRELDNGHSAALAYLVHRSVSAVSRAADGFVEAIESSRCSSGE